MPVHHHPAESLMPPSRSGLNGQAVEANGQYKCSYDTPIPAKFKIFDIRGSQNDISLHDDILSGLNPADGREKRLPTLLLYDEAGLKLFEDITYLDEYYLTEAEIQVLETHADDIAKFFKPGSIILELGSGNLRKINILLKAVERNGTDIEYYALDLSLPELQRTLSAVDQASFKHVKLFGLHGTYNDGFEWLKLPSIASRPKSVLSMGSSIGNFPRSDAAKFLERFTSVLGPNDAMLIGVDACKDPDRVYHAYNDRHGVTHRFILNGLVHANRILGKEAFKVDQWRVIGEYDTTAGRHHAFVCSSQDTVIEEVAIRANEKIRIEESYKYSAEETRQLWKNAGLLEAKKWSNLSGDYAVHALSKTMFSLPLDPKLYAATPAPTWEEWKDLWKLWDTVTRSMIADEELLSKPIKLRNACIFYLGHIPTFMDIKITQTLKDKPTEPSSYVNIFERGIDPDVDNPEHIHAHSAIPDEWPPLEEILDFQERVRERVKDLYANNAHTDIDIGRCLWLGYEHECMHLETLLYMLIQSDKTIPPPTGAPEFKAMAQAAKSQAVSNEWFDVPDTDVVLGLDDPETGSDVARHYGWDIEKPSRRVHVKGFSAKARPITNGEYANYLEKSKNSKIPVAWTTSEATRNNFNTSHKTNGETNGTSNGVSNSKTPHSLEDRGEASEHFLEGKFVKTVYGAIPLAYALDWPVSASYDELSGCAAWMGGRIPTLEEARSIYTYVDLRSRKEAQKTLNTMTPAVNGHLVNDGVEESPPSKTLRDQGGGSGLDPHDRFVDLFDCNVGFQHWHPMAVTQNGSRLSGHADMGGLWEWTSTPLEEHEGFEPMALYPVYSADFFDKKHNVVLGGSWATAPRIAGRKSFVNWYQRNYPYVWAGARLVRDA